MIVSDNANLSVCISALDIKMLLGVEDLPNKCSIAARRLDIAPLCADRTPS